MNTFHLPVIPDHVRRVSDGRGNVYERDRYEPFVYYFVRPDGTVAPAKLGLGQLLDVARDHQLQEVPG